MRFLYQLAINQIKGVGPAIAKQLLLHFHDPESVFKASKAELLKVPGVGSRIAAAIQNAETLKTAEKELTFVDKHNIKMLFWGEDNYPKKLANCIDAPLLLFYKGNADLKKQRVVSMVGTRNATPYGKKCSNEFVEALKDYDVLIVSGLAYGIDTYVHEACIKHQVPTLGVLGHGLDRIYPASNRNLAGQMLERGGLLTEYPSGTKPDRQHFPSRNRIIAGMADVTIVVEAALRGGALITAEIANTYNRDVCAVPGGINLPYSNGCNHLIKTHRANLVTGIKDLEYLMNWTAETVQTPSQMQLQIDLNAREQCVFDSIVKHERISIDQLAAVLQQKQSSLAITILELEMKGLIISLPGKLLMQA